MTDRRKNIKHIDRRQIEALLKEENIGKLRELGYTFHSGWGCDCPGGDYMISVVLEHHESGRDLCLWAWAEVMEYEKDITYIECPVCSGEGCMACNGTGRHDEAGP